MAVCFLAGSFTLFAQNTPDNTITTSGTYNAYSAPSIVQMYFMLDYPTATNVSWVQESDWWRASYNNSGRFTHVYYNTAGDNFLVNRPVAITAVPENIITSAGTIWGDRVYSITTMTGLNGATVYHVHLLRNEERISKWLDANGNEIPMQYLERGYWDNHQNTWNSTNNMNESMEAKMDHKKNMNHDDHMNHKDHMKMPAHDGGATSGEIKVKTEEVEKKLKMETETDELKIKTEGDEQKIKMETETHEIKIKKEGDETKTKIKNKVTGEKTKTKTGGNDNF